MENSGDKPSNARPKKAYGESKNSSSVKPKKIFDVFKLLLHNDDSTPMHFVVQVLRAVFHHSPAEAHALMYEAHTYGVVVVGVFPRDLADAYIHNVRAISSYHGYSLRCTKVEVS